MNYNYLGKTNIKVSEFALGCWPFAGARPSSSPPRPAPSAGAAVSVRASRVVRCPF